ncbi:class I SAM-dependent methyltransferase [Blastomonas sp.]|uniref:class I SAM-dependent methyltransferase n=1 Tax=Blastomonas sp. TaxID=1909299 RepID=UPI0035945B8A
MSHQKNQRFWNRIAARYAARPLKNVPAYEAMLGDVASRLKGSDTVLEVGCGTGGTAIRLAQGVAQWTATDFSAEMVKIAKAKPSGRNVRFVVSDVSNAFDGGPFDAICAFNVLHLVDDLPEMLTRIHAHLKPGGQLICKTWCFADVNWALRALFPVLRVFGLFPVAASLGATQLRQSIRDAGFEIVDEHLLGIILRTPISLPANTVRL